MHFTLISPRLVIQKNDFLGSGVPYWPVELLTLASFIRNKSDQVLVLDLFGNNPRILEDKDDHYLQGVKIDKHIEDLRETDAIIIFAISYMSHHEILSIIRSLRSSYGSKKIIILENSQAVTGYSLQRTAEDLIIDGADSIICGEPYHNWKEIRDFIIDDNNTIPKNVITDLTLGRSPERFIEKNTIYPYPAWDLINLENYWNLPYSHGPKAKKYLPVLTSRGCPYPCDFCVVPETNNRRWRSNSPEEVVKELIYLKNKFGVLDFQIEDLNPTVDYRRWEQICNILISIKANIRFYFVSGTKAETIHIEQVPLLAKAGCRYISISPESGSSKLMKKIGKKFDYLHGLKLISSCYEYGIKTQTCFIVGHPSETIEDFELSRSYLHELVKAGVDEVAIFVTSPFPGSNIYKSQSIKILDKNTVLTFSPKGRENYNRIEIRRNKLIKDFLFKKLQINFFNFLNQCFRSLFGTPKTKIENLPRRVLYIFFLIIRNKIIKIEK